MNNAKSTQPDETTLTLWMDGELKGDALQNMEAWAQQHPELFAERDAVQAMNASIREHISDSIEPPYPDFFNQRILKDIEDGKSATSSADQGRSRGFWQWLAVPVAAGAMALCFYLGTQTQSGDASGINIPVMASVSTVYTPDGGVSSNIFKSEDADATVIVLEGLEDIPDDFDIVGGPSVEDSPGAVMVNTGITF